MSRHYGISTSSHGVSKRLVIRQFQNAVVDRVLRCKVDAVLREHGWLHAEGARPRVSDVPNGVDLLLVDPTPAEAVVAMRLVREEQLRGLVFTDELHRLVLTLHTVEGDSSAIPFRLRQLRAMVPPLEEREALIVEHLPSSPSNRELAELVNAGVATVKRDLASLCTKLGAGGRAELVRLAIDLGYPTKLSSAGRPG
jgi:DNA-binding CsgD family transcriptional regulator